MSDDEDERGEDGNIEIYLRIKPIANPSKKVEYDLSEGKVEFSVPRDEAWGLVNNTRERYDFAFNGILGPEAKQDEVFERVGRRAVLGALDGYNGTVFAYGQTGSGKTYTISGGVNAYSDRGLVPRAISALFREAAARAGTSSVRVRISYLEIYNEVGYDLLGERTPGQAAASNGGHAADVGRMGRGGYEELPRVTMYDTGDELGGQGLVMRGLSAHPAESEEEALNLLFKGDSARAVASTGMNAASSRSHCVFTLAVECRPAEGTALGEAEDGTPASDMMRRSKLHLVDLAGSERVGKTGLDGSLLVEAKYINLSLSYLEQVIVALQERSMGLRRGHVPYRNSTLTTVLRDSLGGNCRTAMIATVQPSAAQIEESIATCRFAQRVAMISNRVAVNEEVDTAAVIRRLKAEVRELREEVRLARGEAEGESRGPLTEDEHASIRAAVERWVADDAAAPPETRGSVMRVRSVQDALRAMLRDGAGPAAAAVAAAAEARTRDAEAQARRLALRVEQRETEMHYVLGMLHLRPLASAPPPPGAPPTAGGLALAVPPGGLLPSGSGFAATTPDARARAFEGFRRAFRRGATAEERAGATLQAALADAAAAAARVNAAAEAAPAALAALDKRAQQRAAATVAASLAPAADAAAAATALAAAQRAEAAAAQTAAAARAEYEDAMAVLQRLRERIQLLQSELDATRGAVQAAFAAWVDAARASQAASPAHAHSEAGDAAMDAMDAHDDGADVAQLAAQLAAAMPVAVPPPPPAPVIPAAPASPPHPAVAPQPLAPSSPALAPPPPAASAPAAAPAVEAMLTGDAEVDEDIRAFMAAKARRTAGLAAAYS